MTTRTSVLAAALFLAAFALPLSGQGRTVTGTVRASDTSLPVAEVNVRLQGAPAGVRTDASGRFTITVPPGSSDVLVFRHSAYDPREVDIAGVTSVNVRLLPAVRYNQYGVPVSRLPVTGEQRDGILVFESLDGSYRFWFDLRVNVDGAVLFGDEFNANGSGAEMRRARMAMKAQLTERWYAEVDMDFADSRADLKDAYLMYSTAGSAHFKMGNFKEVFSLETNTTSRYLTFLERPMVTRALTPSRHMGIQGSYGVPGLLTVAGIHFQDVGGWEEVQNRKDNNSSFGADEGYSLTGKVIAMPLHSDTSTGVHLGVAASFRTPKTHDQVGRVRFDTRGPANINRKKYLDTDRIANVSYTLLGGYEAAAYHKGLKVQGEYNTATVVSKIDDRPDENFNGFYAMASYMLFGGKYRYNKGDGEFTQPSLGRSWGDVEVAARYEYLDLNSREETVMGGSGEAITLGVNVYPISNVKFMLNYSVINHDRYANGRGRLNVGRDADGNLTTNPLLVAAPDGKGGEDYKALSLRIQVSF